MTATPKTKTLSVSIDCESKKAYEFISNPENLPKWVKGLCRSIRKSNGEWIVETPNGPMKFRFAGKNDFGVLDHFVRPPSGAEIYVPMRIVPNGSQSEILFTLFQPAEMPAEKLAEDMRLVEDDLNHLKRTLEAKHETGA